MSEAVAFGRYMLEKRLAIGGMAEVFLGYIKGPEGFRKQVVLKRMLEHLRHDKRHVQMFLDEARLVAGFNHPNLVQVYELAEIEGQYCLAMEYIRGEDAAALLDRCHRANRKIPFEIAAYITMKVADGLHYAHELKDKRGRPMHVVHRDISPANIIVTREGVVKVVDFGIAKHEQAMSQTATGTLKGKFSYMSPEQAKGEKVDRRSDLFSLGIILYELVTVTPCFPGNNQVAVMEKVIRGEYTPPRKLRKDLPRPLESILMGLLEPERKQRYQRASDVSKDLRQYLDAQGSPSTENVRAFLDDIFGETTGSRQGVTAIHDLDEIMVSEELRSPRMKADPRIYKQAVEQRKRQAAAGMQETSPFLAASQVFMVEDQQPSRPPAMGNRPARRRSSLNVVADKMRQPRYWPTTLAIFALTLAVGGGILVGLYRQMIGKPWDPAQTIADSARLVLPHPGEDEVIDVGSLNVRSEPPGAWVVIDGDRVEERTPVTIDNLPTEGQRQVVISMSGFETVTRQVQLQSNKLRSLLVVMRPMRGDSAEVVVTSKPPGARILLDGAATGQVTPTTLVMAANEPHRLDVELDGFAPQRRKITPKGTTRNVVDVRFAGTAIAKPKVSKPKRALPGYLRIESAPPTDVFVDGVAVGPTPVRRHKLAAGEHTVTLKNPRFDLKRTLKLRIKPGGVTERKVVFRKGTVVFDVRPWADVYVGGQKVGTTPMPPKKFYEGSYALRLVNPSLGVERTLQVVVRAGRTNKIVETLR